MNLFVVAVISIMVWFLLMLPFHWWLRHTTLFIAQRMYLLTSLVTGPVIGLIKVYGQGITSEMAGIGWLATIPITINYDLIQTANHSLSYNGWLHQLSVTPYFLLIYYTVMVILAAILMYRVSELWQVVRSNLISRNKGMTIVESPESHTPFSFFNLIFLSSSDRPSGQHFQTILKHEAVHTRQWHSLDVMLAECFLLFTWFLPVILWYKKHLVLLHEYIADDVVLRDVDHRTYGLLLIEQQMGAGRKLTHNFAGTALKKRFLKMTQARSRNIQFAGFLVFLPLATVCLQGVMALNTEHLGVREMVESSLPEEKEREVYLTPTGDLTVVPKKVVENSPSSIPQYPGGTNALFQYISTHLKVPTMPKGRKPLRVITRLNFDASGKLVLITMMQKTDPQLEASVRKVFNAMPDWVPPVINGKAIASEIIIPITFSE